MLTRLTKQSLPLREHASVGKIETPHLTSRKHGTQVTIPYEKMQLGSIFHTCMSMATP